MDTFKRRWNNRAVEDAGAYMSKEANSFCVGFRNMLKRTLLPHGIEISRFDIGHYFCSAHLMCNGNFAYVNYSIPRGGKAIRMADSSAMNGVLFRTADGPEDYRGGRNCFSSIDSLPENIVALFHRMDERKEE